MDKLPGREIVGKPRFKHYKQLIKTNFPMISFFSEDDENNSINFNEKIIIFTV